MNASRWGLAITLLLVACDGGKSSERKKSSDSDEDEKPARTSKVFSCNKPPAYCKEHLGEEKWADVVTNACTDAEGTWSESTCSRADVFGICTQKFSKRTTVAYFYTQPYMTETFGSTVCKEGTWEQKASLSQTSTAPAITSPRASTDNGKRDAARREAAKSTAAPNAAAKSPPRPTQPASPARKPPPATRAEGVYE